MNHWIRTGLALVLALGCGACEDDDGGGYDPASLPGIWIHTQKDGQEVPTDDRFVSIYRDDGTELYAIRGNVNHWVETDGYTYAVGGRIIAVAGHGTQLEYDVRELSGDTLEYRVARLVIDGRDLQDTSVYTLRKVTKDYRSQFLGLWEGHETTDGQPGATHRWKYNADGSYQYYHAQVNGVWQNKADNAGRYFLYGDYFVSNYRNDANSGVAGNACEAWEISIHGERMSWEAFRGGKRYSFTMTRVAE